MAQLEIRNVTRRYGDFVAADNFSLDIEAGEFFTLLGVSLRLFFIQVLNLTLTMIVLASELK